MSLRIAHVTATFPPYRGGAGNVCFHNARELARRGHTVHVFTAAVPGAAAREMCDGVTIRRLRPLVRAGNAPLLPGLLGALHGFDLVHLHCPFIFGAEMTAWATAVAQTRLVVTYHNDLIGDGSWRDHVFRFTTWASRHTALGRADRLLFVSQGHAETCDQRAVYVARAAHCAVLPNGVDTTLFHPAADRAQVRERLGLPCAAPLVGFVGGLDSAHHYKGLPVLLAALRQPALAAAHALIVGDGDLKPQYVEQARQMGLAGRVHFYGAADHTALPALYRACQVVAVPSLVAESFGLVVIEALACAIPVVASDGPGVRALLQSGEYGLLVAAGQVAPLADGLARLLADPVGSAAMGARGRIAVAAHYAWEAIGARLEAVYREALAARRMGARRRATGER